MALPLTPGTDAYPWRKYPQSEAVNAFAKAIGAGRSGVAGGEDDLDIWATFVHDLCELEAAHSRHPDIDEHQADLGTRLKQRQSVMPVVSVKHREAEILEHVDRGGAGQRVIFNDQHRLLAHSQLRTIRTGPASPGGPVPGWLSPAAGKVQPFGLPGLQQTSLTAAAACLRQRNGLTLAPNEVIE